MWFPQFRASRFEMDMKRAQDFGCQGMLGIHWRHRIIDPTATYLCSCRLGQRADRDRTLSQFLRGAGLRRASRKSWPLCLTTAIASMLFHPHFLAVMTKTGFANRNEITGDYSEAFNYRRH